MKIRGLRDLLSGSSLEVCPASRHSHRVVMKLELTELAARFRAALVGSIAPSDPVLGAFPRGCCGSSSEMFGLWLADYRGIASEYVSARDGNATHAWLVVDDVIIDLTCDQFLECPARAPHVGPPTPWHRSWSIEWSRPSPEVAAEGAEHWKETYERVVKALANVQE